MPEFQPSALIGSISLMDAQPEGQKFRASIVEVITQHQQEHANQPELVNFRIYVKDDQHEETVTYNGILPHIEKGENNSAESSWRFRKIVEHEGPLIPSDTQTTAVAKAAKRTYRGSLHEQEL